MLEGKNRFGHHQIGERKVCGVSVLASQNSEASFGLWRHEFHDVSEEDALKTVVEAAPARHAVHVAFDFGLREAVEFFPSKPQRFFDEALDAEIPRAQVCARDVALV